MLSTIAEIIRDLHIFVAVITALLIALVVVIYKCPNQSMKRILTALSYRLGATLAAGALAIPLEPVPGIDVLFDIGVPILLIWYSFTFFRDATSRSPTLPSETRGSLSVDNNMGPTLYADMGPIGYCFPICA